MLAAIAEYWLEWFFFGALHRPTPFFFLGLLVTVAGQLLRWVAFVHAGHSFTHLIEERKSQKHVLVTGGIYRFIRHPGYAGWFYWSVGTQIMLANPLCVIAFSLASWQFFRVRIAYEEELLETPEFFGDKYVQYKQVTPTFIPFIQ
jgi:protein-S-isoprenylcysteine O-methyltransferase